ncbi:hypothetical protein HK101_005623 [Irineochytrium annulatum]|nr:hypothetical protein HK101_005623 [Irineochytrium annulatum]
MHAADHPKARIARPQTQRDELTYLDQYLGRRRRRAHSQSRAAVNSMFAPADRRETRHDEAHQLERYAHEALVKSDSYLNVYAPGKFVELQAGSADWYNGEEGMETYEVIDVVQEGGCYGGGGYATGRLVELPDDWEEAGRYVYEEEVHEGAKYRSAGMDAHKHRNRSRSRLRAASVAADATTTATKSERYSDRIKFRTPISQWYSSRAESPTSADRQVPVAHKGHKSDAKVVSEPAGTVQGPNSKDNQPTTAADGELAKTVEKTAGKKDGKPHKALGKKNSAITSPPVPTSIEKPQVRAEWKSVTTSKDDSAAKKKPIKKVRMLPPSSKKATEKASPDPPTGMQPPGAMCTEPPLTGTQSTSMFTQLPPNPSPATAMFNDHPPMLPFASSWNPPFDASPNFQIPASSQLSSYPTVPPPHFGYPPTVFNESPSMPTLISSDGTPTNLIPARIRVAMTMHMRPALVIEGMDGTSYGQEVLPFPGMFASAGVVGDAGMGDVKTAGIEKQGEGKGVRKDKVKVGPSKVVGAVKSNVRKGRPFI